MTADGQAGGKLIGVFCDGTWNNRDRTEDDTSVGRLEEVVRNAQHAPGQPEQRTWYQVGVGATDGLTGVAKTIDKLLGGALGLGLTDNIVECYRFLVDTYTPGDKLFIFGFSRGAYTARSLAGLIRCAGIVQRHEDVDRALAWYRDRRARTHPSTTASHRLRAEISPHVHTSVAEAEWRAAEGLPVGTRLTIDYLGVFDTVGAHGVPGLLGQLRLLADGHGFHDHQLSSAVLSGRHAVALDESRLFYRPTMWDNLDRLNIARGALADGSDAYQQHWFPGDHGTVGGSGRERRLSNAALHWIVEGAVAAGWPIDLPDELQPDKRAHLGPLEPLRGSQIFNPLRWVPRGGPGPGEEEALSNTAVARLTEHPSYRPASLRKLLLDGPSLARLMGSRGHDTA